MKEVCKLILTDRYHLYVNIHNLKSILKLIHEFHPYYNAVSKDIHETMKLLVVLKKFT